MRPFLLTCIVFALTAVQLSAQKKKSNLRTSDLSKDQYSEYVAQLKSGKTDIDYYGFRYSYLQHEPAGENVGDYDSLRKIMYKKADADDYMGIVEAARQMLELDYTNMRTHRYLFYAYDKLGDTVTANRHRKIERGLLGSILKSGDGRTCATAFEVVKVEEEYYVLNVYGLKSGSQTLLTEGNNTCDKLKVTNEEGKEMDIYFGVNKVFENYHSMFKEADINKLLKK